MKKKLLMPVCKGTALSLLKAVHCLSFIIVITILVTASSCKKSLVTETSVSALSTETFTTTTTPTTPTYCKTQSYCLWAGQTINAGSVVVSNDATNLYIQVNSTGGFQNVAENIKVWVGDDLADVPKNPQNVPIPGQFPLKYTATGTSYLITIPFSSIPVNNGVPSCNNYKFYFLVHVDAIANGKGETAWGGCIEGDPEVSRWYFYDSYTTGCCSTPPPPCYGFTQTAFAKGGYVFTTDVKSNPESLPSLKLTKNRWGWAINLKYTGITNYKVYAGAGLNNTSKGTFVGTLTVNWNGSSAVISYAMNSGFLLNGIHIYANDKKPTTLAPGQYGNTINFSPMVSSYTNIYPVANTDSDGIWIIAHAGVFGNY